MDSLSCQIPFGEFEQIECSIWWKLRLQIQFTWVKMTWSLKCRVVCDSWIQPTSIPGLGHDVKHTVSVVLCGALHKHAWGQATHEACIQYSQRNPCLFCGGENISTYSALRSDHWRCLSQQQCLWQLCHSEWRPNWVDDTWLICFVSVGTGDAMWCSVFVNVCHFVDTCFTSSLEHSDLVFMIYSVCL